MEFFAGGVELRLNPIKRYTVEVFQVEMEWCTNCIM